jgi:23S rRNA (guanosine2251-2'-O)-methyltransferase
MRGEDGAEAPLYGRHPVLELLRGGARRVEELAILSQGRGPALQDLLSLARRRGVRISYRTRAQLTAMAGSPHHQGVVARVAHAAYRSLGDLLEIPGTRAETAFFLALDRVQDPMNLGAVLRTAEAAGVHGVILPKHEAVGLTAAVGRVAMGALEMVPVARETNLVAALDLIRGRSIWVAGAVAAGGRPPWDIDLTVPICLVLGGEGEGIRPLVSRRLDYLLSLPMHGKLQSLNVSAAASALCFEVVRQRMVSPRSEASRPPTSV